MRETEFRGIRIDNGKWAYGYYCVIKEFYDNGGIEHMYREGKIDLHYINQNIVDPKTVGDYTGFKDKNTKKIFDGDIVDDSYISPLSGITVIQRYIIEWENGNYKMKFIKNKPQYNRFLWMKNRDIEVIGNIYDNPELKEE